MKIFKFNEKKEIESIPTDTITDMLLKLDDAISSLDNNKKNITSIKNILSNYSSEEISNMNQIDNSYADLQVVSKKMSDAIELLDTIIKNLKDYNESGEKYLF
jgi:hypothetical protein